MYNCNTYIYHSIKNLKKRFYVVCYETPYTLINNNQNFYSELHNLFLFTSKLDDTISYFN